MGVFRLITRLFIGRTRDRVVRVETRTVIRVEPPLVSPKAVANRSHAPEPARAVLRGPAWVIDGDSIVIDKVQVRLFGIDAPELDHPYGRNAKWALFNLCRGQVVTAELTGDSTYERVVARCTLPDGRDLSAEMVASGNAIDWPKFSGGRYAALEPLGIRKRLWRADARQKGRMPPRAR